MVKAGRTLYATLVIEVTNTKEVSRRNRQDILHLFSSENSHHIFVSILVTPAIHLQDPVLFATSRTLFATFAWASLSFVVDFESNNANEVRQMHLRNGSALFFEIEWIGHRCNMVRIFCFAFSSHHPPSTSCGGEATHLQDHASATMSRTLFTAFAWASLSFALDFKCNNAIEVL